MGLLDSFTDEDRGLLGLALMQAARPRAGGAMGIGEGLLGAINMVQQRKAAQEDREMRKQMQQAQLGEIQAQAQQRQTAAAEQQRKAQEAARIQSLLQRSFLPVTGTQANAVSGITGPRPEALSVVGQQPQVNYQQLLAEGVPADVVKALADARNYGRDKVARTVKGMGPDGREYEYQVDEYGRRVGDGLAQYKAPIQADMGGSVTWRDAYDPARVIASAGKTMTPDGQASNAIARANLGISRERLDMDKANGRDKAPAGYRWTADGTTLEAIPGGPAAGNKPLTEAQAKATTFLGQMRAASATIGQIQPDQSSWREQANVAAAGTPANIFASAKGQQTRQAQEQWAEAFLRFKTGAASTEQEVQRNVRTFFPQMGDTPAVIAQKQRMREQAEADIAIAAGPGAQQAQVVPSIANRPSQPRMPFSSLPSGGTPGRVKWDDLGG